MPKIPPHPHMLLSKRNANLTYQLVLGELIDNSLDAGANRVQVTIDLQKKQIIVEDDGNGCDNLTAMVQLGSHYVQNTTSLGRYGVGLKDAWIWCGNVIEIDSVQDGCRRKAGHRPYGV